MSLEAVRWRCDWLRRSASGHALASSYAMSIIVRWSSEEAAGRLRARRELLLRKADRLLDLCAAHELDQLLLQHAEAELGLPLSSSGLTRSACSIACATSPLSIAVRIARRSEIVSRSRPAGVPDSAREALGRLLVALDHKVVHHEAVHRGFRNWRRRAQAREPLLLAGHERHTLLRWMMKALNNPSTPRSRALKLRRGEHFEDCDLNKTVPSSRYATPLLLSFVVARNSSQPPGITTQSTSLSRTCSLHTFTALHTAPPHLGDVPQAARLLTLFLVARRCQGSRRLSSPPTSPHLATVKYFRSPR